MTELKICNVCNQSKDLTNFYFRNDTSKYRDNCKKCKPLKSKLWVQTRTSKVCKHCNIDKPLYEYQKAGGGRWPQPYCKVCDAERKRKYNEENENKVKEAQKKYYIENREEISIRAKKSYFKNILKITRYHQEYRAKNIEKIAERSRKYREAKGDDLRIKNLERYKKNREKNLIKGKERRDKKTPEQRIKDAEYQRTWKTKNIERIKAYRAANIEQRRCQKRVWCNMKSATDINFKILKNLRGRVRIALKTNIKIDTTENLLGCSIPYFQNYFKSLFTDGMTWDFFMKGDIHIDHILPCKNFDLSKEEEQRKCFHYSNLQPLWKTDNFKKGTKINYKITNVKCSIQSQTAA